jgi:hypothetical protein
MECSLLGRELTLPAKTTVRRPLASCGPRAPTGGAGGRDSYRQTQLVRHVSPGFPLVVCLSFGVAAYALVAYALFPVGAAVHRHAGILGAHKLTTVYARVWFGCALLVGPLQFWAHLRNNRPHTSLAGQVLLEWAWHSVVWLASSCRPARSAGSRPGWGSPASRWLGSIRAAALLRRLGLRTSSRTVGGWSATSLWRSRPLPCGYGCRVLSCWVCPLRWPIPSLPGSAGSRILLS